MTIMTKADIENAKITLYLNKTPYEFSYREAEDLMACVNFGLQEIDYAHKKDSD